MELSVEKTTGRWSLGLVLKIRIISIILF